MECHELSCAPPSGDGSIPDLPEMREVLGRSEHNDTCAQSLRRDVAERPSSLEDQDKEDFRVQRARSQESGDQWPNDSGSTSQARTVPGQVASCTEVGNIFDRA